MKGIRSNVRVDLWPAVGRRDQPRRRWRRGVLRCTLGALVLATIGYLTTPAGLRFVAAHQWIGAAGDVAIIAICVVLAIGADQ